jgi:hypothetical protein
MINQQSLSDQDVRNLVNEITNTRQQFSTLEAQNSKLKSKLKDCKYQSEVSYNALRHKLQKSLDRNDVLESVQKENTEIKS